MKIAIYPGSFNPWHKGHQDVLDKALKIFDKVIIARGKNLEKENEMEPLIQFQDSKIECRTFDGFLKDFIKSNNVTAIIKGLRNGQDFEYEKIQQYWNEDFGIEIPFVYIISDRNLIHYSSSALRQINKLGIK